MKTGRLFIVAVALIAMVGCKSEQKAAQGQDTTATTSTTGTPTQTTEFQADNSIKLDGQPVTVAGVTLTPPASWKSYPASGMRQAVFSFGPTQGESDSATMVVFYFGQQGGGGVQANIERWIGQMGEPDGSDPHSKAKTQDFTVDGMKAHWVDLAGTYNASMGGGAMPGSSGEPKTNYHMAAVVLEGPQGNLFFKLTGPEKTAQEMMSAFRTMIANAKNVGPAEGQSNPHASDSAQTGTGGK